MKKILMFAGALCFVFASCCNNAPEAEATEETQEMNCPKDKGPKCQMTEEEKAECEAFRQKWEDWANLDETAKKELISTAKTKIDAKRAEMKAHLAEMQAKMEEQETAWADFDNKTLDEQKAMLDEAMKCGHHGPKPCFKDGENGPKPCCKEQKPCCKEDKKPCEKKCP
ncbi:MAG: hypothetical protein J5606_02455, partial [Bacteroidales bacterium]|nr:hypothetical protein [Bacteroidales bacterium]